MPILKYFTCVTYSCSEISLFEMDGRAYFSIAVSYDCKMYMKLNTGANVMKLFSSLVSVQLNKLECLPLPRLYSLVYCAFVRPELTQALEWALAILVNIRLFRLAKGRHSSLFARNACNEIKKFFITFFTRLESQMSDLERDGEILKLKLEKIWSLGVDLQRFIVEVSQL